MKVVQLETRVSNHDEILLDLMEESKKIIDSLKPLKKNMAGFINTTDNRKKK